MCLILPYKIDPYKELVIFSMAHESYVYVGCVRQLHFIRHDGGGKVIIRVSGVLKDLGREILIQHKKVSVYINSE